jgi:hypothetical protein
MVDNLIDRYYELRREIINTPPIYFWKLKKLFLEYEKVKQKVLPKLK